MRDITSLQKILSVPNANFIPKRKFIVYSNKGKKYVFIVGGPDSAMFLCEERTVSRIPNAVLNKFIHDLHIYLIGARNANPKFSRTWSALFSVILSLSIWKSS